jgi:hypothetical protein
MPYVWYANSRDSWRYTTQNVNQPQQAQTVHTRSSTSRDKMVDQQQINVEKSTSAF